MELRKSQGGRPLLTLTTHEEIEVVSLVTNYDWAKYPNILHPIKRSIHRNLARRAFDATHQNGDVALPFPLSNKESAIVTEGVFSLEDELMRIDPTISYTTNSLPRDAAVLSIAQTFRALDFNES